MDASIFIPARMDSDRFPGKPLVEVDGKPLLAHACDATNSMGIVITPDPVIADWCEDHGYRCRPYTSPVARSGTERVAYAIRHDQREPDELIVILQCDEPDLTAEDLEALIGAAREQGTPYTLVCEPVESDYDNPHSVMAEMVSDTMLRKFVRANRSHEDRWWRHVGAYVYTIEQLAGYLELGPTASEIEKDLEQLRITRSGLQWDALKIRRPLRSVNVPEDLGKFEGVPWEELKSDILDMAKSIDDMKESGQKKAKAPKKKGGRKRKAKK